MAVRDALNIQAFDTGGAVDFGRLRAGLGAAGNLAHWHDRWDSNGRTRASRPANFPLAHTVRATYGTYYYAQGMYQRGGTVAEEARQLVESLLLAEQKPDGSWQGGGAEASKTYATAMALMSLSVRHHYMPIYQR